MKQVWPASPFTTTTSSTILVLLERFVASLLGTVWLQPVLFRTALVAHEKAGILF